MAKKKGLVGDREDGKKVVSLRQAVVLAKRYLDADADEKTAASKKNKIKTTLVDTLTDKGVDSYSGGGLKITKVQGSTMVYDSDGIWSDLTTQQRSLCYTPVYNFAALGAKRQSEIMAQIRKSLTPAELAAVRTFRLDEAQLSQAVQDKKIPAKVVAAHAEEKKSAPYVRISIAGSGE